MHLAPMEVSRLPHAARPSRPVCPPLGACSPSAGCLVPALPARAACSPSAPPCSEQVLVLPAPCCRQGRLAACPTSTHTSTCTCLLVMPGPWAPREVSQDPAADCCNMGYRCACHGTSSTMPCTLPAHGAAFCHTMGTNLLHAMGCQRANLKNFPPNYLQNSIKQHPNSFWGY